MLSSFVSDLIQLLAASQANKSLIYSVFGSQETVEKLNNINKILAMRVATVSQLYRLLIAAGESIWHGNFPNIDLNNIDLNILFKL